MLKFDKNRPLRAGDVLLVEAVVKYDHNFKCEPDEEPKNPDEAIYVRVGYSDTSVDVSKVHGIARRYFKVGEEVLVEAGKGKVISIHGEWVWLDLGNGTPASVHADSLTRIDDAQPDLLAG